MACPVPMRRGRYSPRCPASSSDGGRSTPTFLPPAISATPSASTTANLPAQTAKPKPATAWGRQSDGAWKFLLDGGAGGMSVEDAERLAGSFRDYPGPAPVPPARPTRHAQAEIRALEREYPA